MTKYLPLLILVGLALLSCENNQKDGFTIKKFDPVNDYGNVDALIEISSGTLEKWEYNKSTGDIELELINNKPRIISYLGYPANYGMIPKTILPKENGGDGDPLDIIVIGPPEPRGSIVKCKIIGVLYLLDNFEQDDKLIAISSKSGLENINNIADLDNSYNGISKILEIWFTNYKKGGNIESKGYGDSINALNILEDARNYYFNKQ
ncbi:MAG: inorganic diphosphatase [Candidatus Neomarinimicrobiota bacterium]